MNAQLRGDLLDRQIGARGHLDRFSFELRRELPSLWHATPPCLLRLFLDVPTKPGEDHQSENSPYN